MAKTNDELFDEIRHQLAVIVGTVELSITLDKPLHVEELLRLKQELIKLYDLLLKYQQPQDDE